MNYTRLYWGKNLNCTVVHKEYTYVAIVTTVLLIVPILFYVMMTFIGTKRHRKMMIGKFGS